ncbi:MAG: porin family protein [Acidobacteriota bacterium]|nr:porin family protein [Acidobacteriota bacterium]
MRIQKLMVLCALCVVLAPIRADAEWFISPFIGAAFGGRVPDAPKIDYGASGGWMGRVVGFEIDVSHRPDFFKANDVPDFLLSESSVTTVMFNGLYRVPIGWERVRPYAAAGIGLLRTRIGGGDDFVRGSGSNVGFNLGGGVMGDLGDRLALRGDVRYFRDLQELEGESEFFSLGNDKLDFWRATVGVAFRF